MTGLYVIGGRQKPGVDTDETDEWHHYSAGLIVSVDPNSGSIRTCAEHVSPPDACASTHDPSILFKAGTLVGNRLYVPTQTELLIYTVPSFERIGYLSLPCFNDVHHVSPGPDGTLLVANTGLDMVVEVSRDGTVRREWSVTGETLDLKLVEEMSMFEPFGAGNPRPVFVTRNLRCLSEPTVIKDRHLKLRLAGPQNRPLEAVWWNCIEGETPQLNGSIEVAYTLETSAWNGDYKMQLNVVDLRKT